MSSTVEFKTVGLKPLAKMDSEDEESFVVLGQSLMPEMDLSFKNLKIDSLKSEPIEEGKQLLKNLQLSQLATPDISKEPTIESAKDQDLALSLPSMAANLSPADIQEKIEMLIDENIKLRDIIVKNNAAMECQHEKIVAWKEEVHNTHQLHKEKFAEAKKFITNLAQEKAHLTAELEKNKEIRQLQETELLQMKEELRQRSVQPNVPVDLSERDRSSLEVETLKEGLKKAVAKTREVEEFLKIVYAQKDTLKKEKDEIELRKNDLISELQKRDNIIAELKKQLKEIEESSNKKILSLNTEMDKMKSQTSMNINLKEDLDNVRKQLMVSQENITRLLQTNSVLEAQLTAEKEKIKELKKLESIKDDYLVIQQQLDIYKADFEEERRLKEIFKAERQQMAFDLQHVQKRNGELQEELEILKERGWQFVSNDRRTSSTSSAPADNRYMCPICKFGFLSYQALENHVERCMTLSETLP